MRGSGGLAEDGNARNDKLVSVGCRLRVVIVNARMRIRSNGGILLTNIRNLSTLRSAQRLPYKVCKVCYPAMLCLG